MSGRKLEEFVHAAQAAQAAVDRLVPRSDRRLRLGQMQTELAELDSRMNSIRADLDAAREAANSLAVSCDEIFLMRSQLDCMARYATVLRERIDLLEVRR